MTKRWVMVACVLAVATGAFVAACGDDDDETATEETSSGQPGAAEADALQDEIADLDDEAQIRRIGDAWAEPFAAEEEVMCGYLHPDIAPAPESCDQYLEGALTRSTVVQRSFAGATVSKVTIEGDTAKATFTNGEPVLFAKDLDGAWRITEVSPAAP